MSNTTTEIPPRLSNQAALFLDFDGSLIELASRPDMIVVTDTLKEQLCRLHQAFSGAVALVSGRSIADLRSYLPDFPGAISGSHGAELAMADGRIETFGHDAAPVKELQRRAHIAAKAYEDVFVEAKPFGLVIHYRQRPDLAEWAHETLSALAIGHPNLVIQQAKMAIELRPVRATKDHALNFLLSKPPFVGRIPVYVGDDLTDEPAFAAAQMSRGFGVKIGPGATIAHYRIADPITLARWLDAASTDRKEVLCQDL